MPHALRSLLGWLILTTVTAAAEEPIFAPEAKLKVEAGSGAGGEGPAWHPELGVLSSGNGNIHRLDRDGKSTRLPQGRRHQRPDLRPAGPAGCLRFGVSADDPLHTRWLRSPC